MGRPRGFTVEDAVAAARRSFVDNGYEGASIDRLVEATKVNRASLYATFGSKHGLFLACLDSLEGLDQDADLDLALVALVERAPTDAAVRERLERVVNTPTAPETLGTRLLARAHLTPATTQEKP